MISKASLAVVTSGMTCWIEKFDFSVVERR
jgi:hypothetical protein